MAFLIYSVFVMVSSYEITFGFFKILLGVVVAYTTLSFLKISCTELFELFRSNNTAACGLIAITTSSASAICTMALFL